MFCKKCGSILKPKKEKNKTVMACSCGYKEGSGEVLKEKVEREETTVEVAEDTENHPVTKAECGKCENNEAYYWMVQTRAGDEPETKFLRCTKCKHTWRDYS